MKQEILLSITPDELKKIIRDSIKELVPAPTESKDKLTQQEAARFLDVSLPTLIAWKKKGLVQFYQIPDTNKIYFYKSELLRDARQLRKGGRNA